MSEENQVTQPVVPVFGLMVSFRPYECTCCGHKEAISTNHTDLCFNYCNSCSWTCSKYPAMIMGSRYYRAFKYVGEPPTEAEYNPYMKEKEAKE